MLYFAYGSNMFIRQMENRCKTSLPICKATLFDYELLFRSNGKRAVATIEPKLGSIVQGGLYHVTRKDMEKLDRFEGIPVVYDRCMVKVTARGKILQAHSYVMNPEFPIGEPSFDYLAKIVKGCMDFKISINHLVEQLDEAHKKEKGYSLLN